MNKSDSHNPDTQNTNRWVFIIVLLLVFIMAARTPLDTDMWWHLRAGEESWRAVRPLLVEEFSFTRLGQAWTNPYWLAQIGMYLLFVKGGYWGLSAMVAVLATASMGLIFLQMEGPPLLKAFIIILVSLVAAPVWSPRPQLWSLVLMAGVGYLLYLYKWRGKNLLWLLIPVFIFWANVHGGFGLGLILMLTMIGGEVLNHLLGRKGSEILPLKRIIELALWGAGSGLAVLINPNGIKIWALPFQTVEMKVLQQHISEWASPDFHQIIQQPFIWVLLLILICAGLNTRRMDGSDVLSISIFCYLGLVARRNFGPFALVAGPVLARYGWSALLDWYSQPESWLNKIFSTLSFTNPGIKRPSRPRLKKAINLSVIGLLAVIAILKVYIVAYPLLVMAYERTELPVEAVDWIKNNNPDGRMFNSYAWGGYLVWSLRDYPVFIDGRTDIFNDEIVEQWFKVVNADPGWEQVLSQWDIHLVVLEPTWAITRILPLEGWHIVFQNPDEMVFIK